MLDKEFNELVTQSEAGDKDASFKLAKEYMRQYNGGDDYDFLREQDETLNPEGLNQAIDYFELAAKQGNGRAHFELARLFCRHFAQAKTNDAIHHYLTYIKEYSDEDTFISYLCNTCYHFLFCKDDGEEYIIEGPGLNLDFDHFKVLMDCYKIILNRQVDDDYKIRQAFGHFIMHATGWAFGFNDGWTKVDSDSFDYLSETLDYELATDYLKERFKDRECWKNAACAIGEWYLENYGPDNEKGVEWLIVGVENGCKKSAEILSKFFSGSYGNEKVDFEKAEKYAGIAASLGNTNAAISLAKEYISKNDPCYKDKIVYLLERVGEQDKEAFYFLAEYYLSINEFEKAFLNFKKGKRFAFTDCNFQIARMLKEGEGCEQDIEEAVDILKEIVSYDSEFDEESANFGLIEYNCSDETEWEENRELLGKAYAELGEIYCDEKYHHNSTKLSFRYLNCGIKCDNAKAYYLLGRLIMDGIVDSLPYEKGKEYIDKALDLGFEPDSFRVMKNKANPAKALEEQIEFYQRQLTAKDELIQKQQSQIEKFTDVLIKTVTETNVIVKRIDEKIDSLLGEVAAIKEENNASLNQIIANQEAYELKITEIGNKIIEKVSARSSLFDSSVYIKEYETIFGAENWRKLSDNSKRYLVTGKALYKTLLNDTNGNVDYSAVCLMVCKTVENELKKRFYFDFVNYLKSMFGDDYGRYHSQLVSSTIDRRTGERVYSLKYDGLICLGDIIYILCPAAIQNRFSGNYIASKNQIRQYINSCVFKQVVNDEYVENLCATVKRIKDDYRNPSCHLSPVRRVTAAECFDYVIDTTRVLINFLNDCKY